MTGGVAGPEDIAAACGFDPSKPNAARVYDYLLGGKDNFAADRLAGDRLVSAMPEAGLLARANRAFLASAVRYAAGHGVGQYVDIGAGLPTAPNVHECAREAVPDARVLYVDHDPVVVAHARALLATDELVTVLRADARDHAAILASPELTSLIDLSQPVCVVFASMLHFLPAAEADAAVAAFKERMVPGSYLVISAGYDPERKVRDQIQAAYGSGTVLTGRSKAEIADYFRGFELVPPGLVPVTDWLASREPALAGLSKAGLLVGIARKGASD